jgi:pilus assembly protein CpaB
MNRNRLVLIGILALAVAGVISLGAYKVLRVALASAHTADTTVVAAMTDLPVGARLEEKDLRLVKMPGGDLPEGVFHAAADVVGRGVIVPVAKNELLTTNKVAGADAGAGMSAVIPAGMRAVSVKVNDVVAVAGFAVPGTRVDVLLTGNPNKNNDPADVTTTTVLENVQVLAAGQKLQTDAEGKPENVPVITLLVSPEDAEKLTLASSEGKIQLSLRNPLDVDPTKLEALRNASLYHLPAAAPTPHVHQAKKQVTPVPAAVYTVEMIHGDKRDFAKF